MALKVRTLFDLAPPDVQEKVRGELPIDFYVLPEDRQSQTYNKLLQSIVSSYIQRIVRLTAETRLNARQSGQSSNLQVLQNIPEQVFQQMFVQRSGKEIISNEQMMEFRAVLCSQINEHIVHIIIQEFQGTDLERYANYPGMVDTIREALCRE